MQLTKKTYRYFIVFNDICFVCYIISTLYLSNVIVNNDICSVYYTIYNYRIRCYTYCMLLQLNVIPIKIIQIEFIHSE